MMSCCISQVQHLDSHYDLVYGVGCPRGCCHCWCRGTLKGPFWTCQVGNVRLLSCRAPKKLPTEMSGYNEGLL